jgi:hypothetical protein
MNHSIGMGEDIIRDIELKEDDLEQMMGEAD